MLNGKSKVGPLAGIRVLDLTRAVAGPFCTMLLGDLGAKVTKIEEPGVGDETRHWGPAFTGGESAYFLALNRNKRSVTLDLKIDRDQAVLMRMARESDIVVQNFRPGVAERLGVGYGSVRAENPAIIYASISGFGTTGPDRERPGYDLIVQAMSGVMRANGADGVPTKVCFPVADVLAGQFACQGILSALFERARTGLGNHIDVSLLESLLFATSQLSTLALMNGKAPDQPSAPGPAIVPYQVLNCRDAAIAVAVPNQRIWMRFCEVLKRPEWIGDERYSTNRTRTENRRTLVGDIELVMRERDSADWLRELEARQIPCGPVLSVSEIFYHPQIVARGVVTEVEHPVAGPVKLVANPVRFADRDLSYVAPPVLGQHTAEVLATFSIKETPLEPAGSVHMKGKS